MAGKPFFIQFVPDKWRRKTFRLKDATKAVWIDLICELFDVAPSSGEAAYTLPQWAVRLARTERVVLAALRELQERGIADIEPALSEAPTGPILIRSRRLARDAKTRSSKAGRQGRWRGLRAST